LLTRWLSVMWRRSRVAEAPPGHSACVWACRQYLRANVQRADIVDRQVAVTLQSATTCCPCSREPTDALGTAFMESPECCDEAASISRARSTGDCSVHISTSDLTFTTDMCHTSCALRRLILRTKKCCFWYNNWFFVFCDLCCSSAITSKHSFSRDIKHTSFCRLWQIMTNTARFVFLTRTRWDALTFTSQSWLNCNSFTALRFQPAGW